ncbi:MAG: LysM peptidoglycan-binding domain-containing protein [Cyclobacteriaceae bacterium]
MRFFAAALFFLGAAVSNGQTPEVPHKMQFAGMTLVIKDDARREIQKDVDALTQHPYYFNMKVERAKTYFPIIEKIFLEERLPDDFKYLALQESALISDAVSSSNAVGFWQFKDFTAEEVGMRVDKDVDERMNLISATRGAARYLKQNNFYFNNWIYALQAYQMGAGGARRAVGDKHNGAKHMEINGNTYWYVKKYLAHKIAFENAIEGDAQLKLVTHVTGSKTSLKDIANEYQVDLETMEEYNKWARRGAIPDDKQYTVLIPQGAYDQNFTKLSISAPPTPILIETGVASAVVAPSLFVNGVSVVMANPGDRITTLADRAGISLSAFLRFNDVSIDHVVIPGKKYFVEKKKRRASEAYHKVMEGENLWMISQTYGVQLKKLRKYNRLDQNEKVYASSMLWLSSAKPPKEDVPPQGEIVELDTDEEFNWGQASLKGTITSPEPVEEPEYTVEGSENSDSQTNEALTVVSTTSASPSTIVDFNEHNSPIVHEVKSSDTLYSVARQYGVTIKELMEWNEKKDFNLSLGEKLRILMP